MQKDDNSKAAKSVSISQILAQFWNGVKPVKVLFFLGYFFFFISQLVNLFVPLYYKNFFDVISKSTNSGVTAPLLVHTVVIILIFHAFNWIFWRAGMNLFNTMETKVMARLKQNAFDYMIKHSYTFFANTFTGSLVQRVGRFSRAFESLADSLAFNLLPLIITVVGSIWITWFIAPTVSIILASGLS
jgi:ABC-type multidrug transport system fused ATPase/permease subunit